MEMNRDERDTDITIYFVLSNKFVLYNMNSVHSSIQRDIHMLIQIKWHHYVRISCATKTIDPQIKRDSVLF